MDSFKELFFSPPKPIETLLRFKGSDAIDESNLGFDRRLEHLIPLLVELSGDPVDFINHNTYCRFRQRLLYYIYIWKQATIYLSSNNIKRYQP